ncbi:MAG: O-antigen ligase family protein [Acidobacteriota bacterium]|nr:MAG: O-antigen ligase family protein [Acidobacteriota bacterium]
MIESTRVQLLRRTDAIQRQGSREFKMLVFVSLLHLPLGIAIYSMGSLALLHPYAALAVGLYWAASKKYSLERVAFAIAYIVGAEVLWRMAAVPVFWEFGKYASALIAVVALVRRSHLQVPAMPLLYFAFLIPACVLTLFQFDFAASRAILSFQMSGPLLLMTACWLFSKTKFTSEKLRLLLLAILVPVFSVAFATLFFTVTSEEIQFTGESNFATSGGFGPNQVSSMLGLGAFAALACLLVFKNSARYRVYLLLAAVFFSVQSVMTFSRGGIFNAIGAIIVIVIIEFQRPSIAAKRLLPIVGLVIIFFGLLLPFMDDFTDGRLTARFQDIGTTNRAEIAESDLYLFLENPFLGVGVGNSGDSRAELVGHTAVSHTEFSRLLSEHGMFGAAALILLVAMGYMNFKRQKTVMGRAFVAGAAVWCCLFMTNAGMRMAAPSFMWGLTFVTIVAGKRVFALKYKAKEDRKQNA